MKYSSTLLIKLGVFSVVLMILAFSPRYSVSNFNVLQNIDSIVDKLRSYSDKYPHEKVYLHTDKPYYLIGDTIWFKAYVTTGSKNQLSAISGALYLDLITEGDSIAERLKLPMKSGMAVGDLVLHDSLLREGNYRIRAYTQWMRNAGPDYFYDRTFTIGNSIANTVFAKIDYLYIKDGDKAKTRALLKYTDVNGKPYIGKKVSYQLKETYQVLTAGNGVTNAAGELIVNLPNAKPDARYNRYLVTKLNTEGRRMVPKTFSIRNAAEQADVQFFPESGNLVNGIKSKVAFKAIGVNGLGLPIKVVITDNNNNEVARSESKHLGMGVFSLMPETGKSYTAKITYPDGSTNIVKLPDAITNGYVLSTQNTRDSIMVRINRGPGLSINTVQPLILIGQMGGEVYFSEKVPVRSAGVLFFFPVKDLPQGVLQFTLFDTDGTPLNERVVFINNKNNINISASTDKPVYKRREKVELSVSAKDKTGKPIAGNFSVSVVSEDAVPSNEVNENSILAQLLLSSDINGYIEKPNYYFHNPDKETNANLDILMLTQGYRRFGWKSVLGGNIPAPQYKADKLVSEISGKLTTLVGNKPVSNGKVMLLNNKTNLILDAKTDSAGNFKFDSLFIQDGASFTLQGRGEKGGDKLKTTVYDQNVPGVTLNKNIGDLNADIPQLVKAMVQNSLKQDLELQKHGKLSRVQQLNEVIIRGSKARYGGGINESEADEVFRPDARMPCATLMECLIKMPKSRIDFRLFESKQCGRGWRPVFGNKIYLVVIDGNQIAECDYQSIILGDMSNIDKVYTSHESPAVTARLVGSYMAKIKSGYMPPVIAIYTKNGVLQTYYNPSTIKYKPKGYNSAKLFYSPKYDPVKAKEADLRSTIYWNAGTITDANGQTKINYHNADQVGIYRVTIEGIDADGRLGRRSFKYQVSE